MRNISGVDFSVNSVDRQELLKGIIPEYVKRREDCSPTASETIIVRMENNEARDNLGPPLAGYYEEFPSQLLDHQTD